MHVLADGRARVTRAHFDVLDQCAWSARALRAHACHHGMVAQTDEGSSPHAAVAPTPRRMVRWRRTARQSPQAASPCTDEKWIRPCLTMQCVVAGIRPDSDAKKANRRRAMWEAVARGLSGILSLDGQGTQTMDWQRRAEIKPFMYFLHRLLLWCPALALPRRSREYSQHRPFG